MAVVQSGGALEQVSATQESWSYAPTGVTLYGTAEDYTTDYAAMYRTQPALRTVLRFLAWNIAEIGLKVYRRLGDDEREHLAGHPLAETLRNPGSRTRFWTMVGLVSDFGLYDRAHLAVMDGRGALVDRFGGETEKLVLKRIPPWLVTRTKSGDFLVGSFNQVTVPAWAMVYVHGYDPRVDTAGVSPVETLRRTLAEADAAERSREQLWRRGARISGVIERPADAPLWSDVARARFTADWRSSWSGDGPDAGGTPILEEGMSFTPVAFSPEQAQYVQAKRLTREECAAAYGIPPPMVGLMDNANYSNTEAFRRILYSDTLGPWLTMIQEEIAQQLLPLFADTDRVYVEFNIAEKLKASFEERARSIQSSVGAPWMTRNEARSLDNRPPVEGGDELIVPLNVISGGLASPNDTAPPEVAPPGEPPPKAIGMKGRPAVDVVVARTRRRLGGVFGQQRASVLSKLGAKSGAAVGDVFDRSRWDAVMRDALLGVALDNAEAHGASVALSMGAKFDLERLRPWLEKHAEIGAARINRGTEKRLERALADDDPVAAVKAAFSTGRLDQIAQTTATTTANFGAVEGGKQAAARQKTWVVTSPNARREHAALAGAVAPLEGRFANGLAWPGDPAGAAGTVTGCTCTVDIS